MKIQPTEHAQQGLWRSAPAPNMGDSTGALYHQALAVPAEPPRRSYLNESWHRSLETTLSFHRDNPVELAMDLAKLAQQATLPGMEYCAALCFQLLAETLVDLEEIDDAEYFYTLCSETGGD